MVSQRVGAVGYIELAYAIQNNLPTALMKNQAGQFQGPTVEAISLSAHDGLDYQGDLRLSIVDAPAPGAYPISAFTYILIPDTASNERQKAVRNFLHWAISDGQQYAGELHYAPLPKKLQTILLERLAKSETAQ